MGCAGGDLWRQIGAALRERGGGRDDAGAHRLNSHTSEQEALAKGVPWRIWAGNKAADCADAGAKTHAISDTQTGCYEWVRATARLVRERIAAATKTFSPEDLQTRRSCARP